ncbi:mitochondrial-processing peptidase subunit alpha-like protein, partial [Tanacetum coccineum]
MVASEDIGRQILTYGERKPVEFLKVVDEVTAKDITSLAQKLLCSPLTMASHGDVIHVGSGVHVDGCLSGLEALDTLRDAKRQESFAIIGLVLATLGTIASSFPFDRKGLWYLPIRFQLSAQTYS